MFTIDDNEHNLNLSNFNGPIDLLLSLVRDKQMNIMDINLIELANEYIKVIDKIKRQNIDLASEYLLMASTLLQIKANTILAPPEINKTVEASKKNLLKKLVERQQFKNVSTILRTKEKERTNIFIKNQSPVGNYQYKIDESHLDGTLDAVKIITSLRRMFERTNANKMRQATITKFKFSPAERRAQIIDLLKKKATLTFEEIFSVPTMNHFVVTVVTILDMARKQELVIKQKNQFSDIWIKRGDIDGV